MKLTVEGDPEEIKSFFRDLQPADNPESKDNTCGIHWSGPEEKSIEHAKDWYEAIDLYRAAFPESKRNRNAIRKHFWEMQQKKPPVSPLEISGGTATGPVLPAGLPANTLTLKKPDPAPVKKKGTGPSLKKGNHAKNFDADPWVELERDIVRKADSREDAIASYRERYPESTRSDDAIGRQFYELRPDKRDPKAIWTDQEKQPILDADNVEEAIADHRKLFPESTRTTEAIQREWYELRPEKRGEVPTGRKKGGTNKAPLKGTAREKYGIPFSTKKNKKGYNHAVYICKKYGKPYEEAVELEEADLKKAKEQKQEKKPGKKMGRSPLSTSKPEKSQLNCDKIVTGINVRQAKPVEGKIFFGIGTVTARNGDLVEISNGGKKKYTLDVQNLEIAPPPAKASKKTSTKKPRLPYTMKNQPPEDPEEEPTTTQYPEEQSHTATDEDPLDPPQQDEEEHLSPPSDGESLSPPPVPPGQEQKQAARTKGPVPGQKVRHNGSSSSPFYKQDGEIIKILPDGEVLVKFGKSEVKLPTRVLLPYPYKPAGEAQ
jgi:hypothetical protein